MADVSAVTKDLVDLKDHCLLCFREVQEATNDNEDEIINVDAEEGEFGEISNGLSLSKRFLKLLTKYLRLPSAELTIMAGEDDDDTVTKIQACWDDLITASVCETCKELVTSFCDLYFYKEYIKIQLQNKIQELEQCIHFTDQDSTCNAGKRLLGTKWDLERTDSQHFLKLLAILRTEILASAAKKKTTPMVLVRRMSDQEIHHHTIRIKEHRQSVEDSGVSMYSGLSPTSSIEENCSRDQDYLPENQNFKKQTAIRTVFKCKKCMQKFFTKEKLKTHALEAHPKSAINQSNTTRATAIITPIPQQKVCKIRKTAYICRAQNCTQRFLSEQRLIDHVKDAHKNLAESFPQPSTSNAHNSSQTSSATISSENIDITKIDNAPESLLDEGSYSNEESGSEQNAGNESPSPKPIIDQKRRRRNFECSFKECDKKFHTAEELLLHAQFHRKHPCSFCGEICKNPSSLAVHEYQHHKKISTDKSVTCPRCPNGTAFANYVSYRSHFYNTHLGVKPPLSKCPKCNHTFQSKGLKQHIVACTKPRVLASELDGVLSNVGSNSSESNTGTPSVNRKPSGAATPSTKYACNICSLNCSSATSLQSHIIARHDPNIVFCGDCDRMFGDSESLRKHRAFIHFKFKVFMKFCPHCGTSKTFTTIAQFNAHIKQHETSGGIRGRKKRRRLSECPTCHKKFRNLKTHMHVHMEKPREKSKIKEQCQSENTVNNSSTEQQNEQLANDLINEKHEDESLMDRIKLRQRSESRLSKPILEESDESSEPKKRGKKRGRKPKTLIIAPNSNDNHTTEETEHEEIQQPNKKKKQGEVDDENCETSAQDQNPSEAELSQVSETIESTVAPRQSTSSSENDDGYDSPERQPTNDSESIVAPVNPNDDNPEEDSVSVRSPAMIIKQEPRVNERFLKWMAAKETAQKVNTQRNATITRPIETSEDDCIILSGDEDDEEPIENVDKKPDVQTVVLNKRVKSWLTERQSIQISSSPTTDPDSSDVEIITLD